MKWYYSRKGNVQERGLAEEGQLRDMAEKGTLSRDDLVCPESGGAGWIRADSREWLFPKETPKAPTAEAEEEDDKKITAILSPQQARRPSHGIVILLAIVLLAVIAAFFFVNRPKSAKPVEELPPPPTVTTIPAPVAQMDTQQVEEVMSYKDSMVLQIEAELSTGSLETASTLLYDWVDSDGTNETTEKLRRKLNDTRNARLMNSYVAEMMAGRLTDKNAASLLEVAVIRQQTASLRSTIADALANPATLTSRQCESLLKVLRLLQDKPLFASAAREYVIRMDATNSLAACMALVQICHEAALEELAVTTLNTYLKHDPAGRVAWLELAAIHASAKRQTESFAALKKALGDGDGKLKRLARNDSRFDSIRKTVTFKRLTE